MSEGLRIAVADDEPDMRDYFVRVLPRLGHRVVAAAADGRELVEACRLHRPDLVITDIRMPEMDGIEAATAICREAPVPVLLVSAHHEPELIERAEADHVMGYLVKPVKLADLAPAIALAVRRFGQLEALRREARDLRQALEDRKLVERAAGVLVRQGAADEESAFARLRQLAGEKGLKLVEAARLVLGGEGPSPPAVL